MPHLPRPVRRLLNRLRARGRRLPTWYHPAFRLPLTSLASRTGLDPRRADLAAWTLLDLGAVRREDLHTPAPARWTDVALVHDDDYLEALVQPGELARIFAVEEWDLPLAEVLRSVRLAVGATVEAARHVLAAGGPAFNLGGGLHHAAPTRGAGFCPLNDIAVAVAVARKEGFSGAVGVLDLDAHPPDGTAACLESDPDAWIGSLSGADWGPLPGRLDETVLPEGTGDAAYLDALDALLARAPRLDLLFVLAGGDVRAADPVGPLGLTEEGLRARDARVAAWRGPAPTVWLPAGGYGPDAWRVVVHTGLQLTTRGRRTIPADLDPLRSHLSAIARDLRQEDLEGEDWLTDDDLADLLGAPGRRVERRLLDFYTAAGVELALERYGMFEHSRRLGYGQLRVVLDRASTGDRMRVFARPAAEPPPLRPPPADAAAEGELLLVEIVVDRETAADGDRVLFVHWMTLRHPLAAFDSGRPPLPGQEVPGLGMAREAGELLALMAERLGLAGVAVRPAWYHVAYASRYEFRFEDPRLQGEFEAITRDLAELPLRERTHAVHDGRVRRDGAPYAWEPGLMRNTPGDDDPGWRAEADAARDRVRFSLGPAPDPAPGPPGVARPPGAPPR